jgi:threonine synthase
MSGAPLVYHSTRGEAPTLGFSEVLLTGLAPDGGLYLPTAFPRLTDATLSDLRGAPYQAAAKTVMAGFLEGDPALGDLDRTVDEACAAFAHPAVAPLYQTGPDDFVLELFHGPTLAFKDVAMQWLGPMFSAALARAGRRMTIVAATSGDTGGAAIEAMAGRDGVDICVLHPHGRISEVQRRFMTTTTAPNVLNVAVDGTFDDCQAIVKDMFADDDFREGVSLGAVNSINWARIVAQTVYYVTAALTLGGQAGRPVHFSVPTGNFGDIFAGHVARAMGAPIGQLIVATNENDILDRALRKGSYRPTGVVATRSPSMDIEVSSNFERLLFLAADGDVTALRGVMAELKRGDGFDIPPHWLARIRADFTSHRADEAAVEAQIAQGYRETGRLHDPHTAVGLVAAHAARREGLRGPVVTLATAHAAKFPDAVEAATGVRPGLPPHVGDLFAAEERLTRAPNDAAAVKALVREAFLRP